MCARADEDQALAARVLQTELMVAALTCGEQQLYNTFVTRFQPELVERGKALSKMFQRAYGNKGTAELTTFVTRLANEASMRSLDHGLDYCAKASAMFQEALAVDRTGFATFVSAQSFSDYHGVAGCTVGAEQARRPARR